MRNLTDLLMESRCPVRNPYQGTDKRILFVCSAGLLRSATAARIYANKYNTRAAGTHPFALVPISPSLVLWADEIVFVNNENYEVFAEQYDMGDVNLSQKVVVLEIPDKYEHMHPELIKAFEEQYEPRN